MAGKPTKKPAKSATARIEVFRPGSFTAMSGEEVTYTADDLAALAKTYDPENFPAPAVVGHPKHNDPACAWISGLDWDADANRLYADLDQIEDQFGENVKAGRYKRISMSFYMPDASANPRPGAIYPRHVGFLGGAAPAVSGLAPVAFKGGGNDVLTIEFGERAFSDVANVFQKLREFLIEKFGREDADEAIPSYLVNWIDDAVDTPGEELFTSDNAAAAGVSRFPGTPAVHYIAAVGRGAPVPGTPAKNQPEEKPMSSENDDKAAEFAERKTDLDAREKKLADQEAATAHREHEAFADTLVTDGRLVTGSKPKVVALMDAVATNDSELSFADCDETKKSDALSLLKNILEAQPKIVSFGNDDMGDDPIDTADGEKLGEAAASYIAEKRSQGIEVSASNAVAFIEKQGAQS